MGKQQEWKEEELTSFLAILSDPTISVSAYQVAALNLKKLLPEIPTPIKNLIIIPDGTLANLPFAALPLDDFSSESFREVPFLMQKYRISYASSATLWCQQQQTRPNRASQFWAGFAPNYETKNVAKRDTTQNHLLATLVRSGSLHLPGALTEIKTLTQQTGGDAYLQEQATQSLFREVADNYQVLHLAMHNLLDTENPLNSRLLFAKQDSLSFLTLGELYELKTNADLVVLSACQTGNTTNFPGRGSLSLSHAFMASGCPSTLMTFWKVPDKESASLMLDFYRSLEKGQHKPAALQTAQLNYLENIEFDPQAHPYFWAGYSIAGNTKPLKSGFNTYWLLLLGIVTLLIGVFLFLRVRPRHVHLS